MASNVNEEGYYNGARARAQKYSTLGSSQVPAVRWVLVDEGGRLPEGALQVGQEADGSPMCVWPGLSRVRSSPRPLTRLVPRLPSRYAARAFHDGCASIGKTWTNQERWCVLPRLGPRPSLSLTSSPDALSQQHPSPREGGDQEECAGPRSLLSAVVLAFSR